MKEATETIIDGAAASIRFHPKSKVVHQEVKRFVRGAELRALFEKSLENLAANRATKWLSDDRASGPLAAGDADWVVNDWAPRMLQVGWRFWAAILPKRATGPVQFPTHIRRWMEGQGPKQPVVAKAFLSPEPALEWLENPLVRWSMFFWRDPLHDVVTMTFHDCVLETPEDATDFMRLVFAHIQRHKTPTDVLIDYSGLVVKPAAARQFGLERAEFGRRFVKRSYRFSVATTSSRTAIYTSSVLEGAHTNLYTTRDDALAALLAQRSKESLP